MDNMLTVEEVKRFLEIDEKQLEKYLRQGRLHAYKIGGSYLRFRKDEALNLRHEIVPGGTKNRNSLLSRIGDFWHFNNFYIISILIVIAIALAIILS
jgi:hypothetical protein